MNTYGGKDETTLRKLLDTTSEYGERRKIRAAIRELKTAEKNYNNNNNVKPSTNKDSEDLRQPRVEKLRRHGNADSDGDAWHSSGDESKAPRTRYRHRNQTEDELELEKTKLKEKENHPKIENIKDEEVLTKMLKDTTVYEERKKIRAAIRELRKTRDQTKSMTPEGSPVARRTRRLMQAQEEKTETSTRKEDTKDESNSQRTSTSRPQRNEEEKVKDGGQKSAENIEKISEIQDENVLKQMLKDTDNYDERKKIRITLRELRRKNREKEDESKDEGTHSSTVLVQLENKEVEKRNGEVKIAEIAINPVSQNSDVKTNTPLMSIKTHAKTKLDKFEMPSIAPRKLPVEDKIEDKTEDQDDNTKGRNTISIELCNNDNQEKLIKTTSTVNSSNKGMLGNRVPEPKKIELQITNKDENSFEEIEDLEILENMLLSAKKTDVRLKIRSHIRDVKKRKADEIPDKTTTEDDGTRNTCEALKLLNIERKEEKPITKTTTAVMTLREPSKIGENIRREAVHVEKTNVGVRKTSRTTFTLSSASKSSNIEMKLATDEDTCKTSVVTKTVSMDTKTQSDFDDLNFIVENKLVVDDDNAKSINFEIKPQTLVANSSNAVKVTLRPTTDVSGEVDGLLLSKTAAINLQPQHKGTTTAKTGLKIKLDSELSETVETKHTSIDKTQRFGTGGKFHGADSGKEKDALEATHKGEEVKNDSEMAPPAVAHIEDEAELETMLDATTDFDDRRAIRSRLREIRKKKKEERENRLLQKEKNWEKEKRERIHAKDLKIREAVGLGVPKASITVNNNNTVSTEKNANTITTNTGGTISKTTTTEEKTAGGTTAKRTTTITESKDGGTQSKTVEQETMVSSKGSGGSSMSVSKTSVSTTSSVGTGGKKLTKFEEELAARKKAREEKQLADTAKFKEDALKRQKEAMERKKMDAMSSRNKRSSIMDKFGGASKGGAPSGGVARGGMRVQNANTIKTMLLEWCKARTAGYENCEITNFSSSWANGMAFCALIHHYFPDAFDYRVLNPKNRRRNFDLAFNTAETKADIMPLLETEDMLLMGNKPDWKCVFTYVQSLYRHLQKLD
uniref:Smoothelin-like isoform X2 n=1 Tax=Saccoglossus kowalevskii TaxID=10224 RepID=A0ABM0MAS4_SACKO|nr:PREDICTED: smoothelin-like isoform X2 [Saccoglossus kowalevskii]